jgi:serine protein kinase
MATSVVDVIQKIRERQDPALYHDLHWEGSFPDYLRIVQENPLVVRNAFQRLYDMIISFGTRRYTEYKKEITHYNFFDDPVGDGRDAIFGLDVPMMKFVQVMKAAAMGYGPERRVLLLHGPVGSSKSTIARLLKRGLEHYSRTPEGALYTFSWIDAEVDLPEAEMHGREMPCPMHEDPFRLLPPEFRATVLDEINQRFSGERRVVMEGELCPACRHVYNALLQRYDGDWTRMIEHVRVRRLLLSEQDRVGIGTFQP